MPHNILYILGLTRANSGEQLPDRKIGITGSQEATLESRVLSLNGTKSPFIIEPLAAWRVDDARSIESVLHTLLQPIHSQGEWFLDQDDYLVEAVRAFMDREPSAERIEINTQNDPLLTRAKKLRAEDYQNDTDRLFGVLSENFDSECLTKPYKDGFIGLEGTNVKIWTRAIQRGFSLLIHPKSPEIEINYELYHSILESLGLQYHHRPSKNGEFIQSRCDDAEGLVSAIRRLLRS